MKTRNKVFIGGGILFLVLVVAGYNWVSAYGPWNDSHSGFYPRFHGRGFHSGVHHQDMADFILWKMDKKARELNLTAGQKAKYEAVKENFKGHFSQFLNERQKMKDQFHKELEKEEPDLKFLMDSSRKKLNEFSSFMDKNLVLLLDFYNSLDNHQKRLINDEIRERMKYHRS
ncbi:MAG: hypothetical protein HY787_22750 [Deltaproteobacteria bacterium]|nr:hypothetical protein [Deltaproteobacteria bacterium]